MHDDDPSDGTPRPALPRRACGSPRSFDHPTVSGIAATVKEQL